MLEPGPRARLFAPEERDSWTSFQPICVSSLERTFELRSVVRGSDDTRHAGIAQLVERNLAKVEVAGSNPVARFDTSDAQETEQTERSWILGR